MHEKNKQVALDVNSVKIGVLNTLFQRSYFGTLYGLCEVKQTIEQNFSRLKAG